MKDFELPTLTEAISAIDNGTATPIETFIYKNEPRDECIDQFRGDLLDLINHIKDQP